MKILALDTSTDRLSLAVSDNGKIIRFRNIVTGRKLSSSIIRHLDKIMQNAGLSLKALDGLAVGLGPGSFTSLRVGLSTVKGLAFALGKPIVGICSMDAIALNVPQGAAQVCVIQEARRGMVFSCVYEKQGESVVRKSSYSLADLKDVLRPIQKETVFIGDGLRLYKDTIKKNFKFKALFVDDQKAWYPSATKLPARALPRFKNKMFDDNDAVVPLYLYAKDCQVKRS